MSRRHPLPTTWAGRSEPVGATARSRWVSVSGLLPRRPGRTGRPGWSLMPRPTSRQARAAGSALMVLPPAPGPAGAEVIATRAASLALADVHAHQLGRHTVDRNRFFGQPPLQAKQRGSRSTVTSSPAPAGSLGPPLVFAAHSDPEVGVVDGYAVLPLAVQRGQQPIDLAGGQADPCARPPTHRFTSSERAAIQGAFGGRAVSFVQDPAAALRRRPPGSLRLVATQPLLAGRRGTVMVLSCVPDPQQVLVTVHWDGHAWRAMATGAGKR
jgi:hypothetical protein